MIDESILTALRENRIQELDLECKHIDDVEAQALAEVLLVNTSLQELNLGRNHIENKGAQALAEALKRNTSLQRLSLMFNQIGAAGAQAIAESLKGNATLQYINLRDNPISATGVQVLAGALKENTGLQHFNLGGSHCYRINNEGAQALADALKINTTIQQLDLTDNQIGVAGAQALAEVLKGNTSLQRLNLMLNQIGAAGTQVLAEALKKNASLKQLMLWDNEIGTAGAQALAEALKENTSLQQLDLRDNKIDAAGVQALTETLKKNTSLQKLGLRGNQIGAACALALVKALKDNYTLVELSGMDLHDHLALAPYIARNQALLKAYQQAEQAFNRLAGIHNSEKLLTAAEAILKQLEEADKYPKTAELRQKTHAVLFQHYFEHNEWEHALMLDATVLKDPKVCFSFADWLIRQEEIPAALASGNNAEINRINLAMLLLVEASQENTAEIPQREIETFKINIANRIIQNTKSQVKTDKVGLTTASLTEVIGAERLLSTGEWRAAIEHAVKLIDEEDAKRALNDLAQQVASHSVEDVKALLSFKVIRDSLRDLYKTYNCLPVGVMLLSPESLPWRNQVEVSDTKAFNQWFICRQRQQHFDSKKEEKQQAIDSLIAAAKTAEQDWQTQEEIRYQEAKAKRWNKANLVLSSGAVLCGLAAMGIGISMVYFGIPLLMFLSIVAGSLAVLLLVGALACAYQQGKVIEVKSNHTPVAQEQNGSTKQQNSALAIATAAKFQPVFSTSAEPHLTPAGQANLSLKKD